jgi:hypothetical protein
MKQLFIAVGCVIAFMAAATIAMADAPKLGALSGQFMISPGMPMSEGLAYFYNLATGPAPSRDRYWRVPDNVKGLDKEGRFTIELAAGDYCVGAVKRHGSPQIGPPQKGDVFLLDLDDKGKPKIISVSSGKNIDMGVVSGASLSTNSSVSEGLTAVEGVVRDSEGKPVEGALVLAFISPTIIGKPLFVSERSGKDGRFLLRVHEGGIYYLKLRNTYGGGPPRAGAILDGNKEEPLHQVSVKTGETARGVVLTGKIFPGRGRDQD